MKNRINVILTSVMVLFALSGCKIPEMTLVETVDDLPPVYSIDRQDSVNVSDVGWRLYFGDEVLTRLIDTALQNNQELSIVLQELEVGRNEILEKRGEYLPFVNPLAGIGAEKPGRFTPAGAVEHQLEVEPGREFPDPLGDFVFGLGASWEVDIWKRMRNAQSAAEFRYLAMSEGRNFLVTRLIAEIASSYYELLALDNKLQIISKNLDVQSDALRKMELLRDNAKANQLAVNRFKAQLLNTTNQQFALRQKRVETETRIQVLVGRPVEFISRDAVAFTEMQVDSVQCGIPSQLLSNRPDIRAAEYEIAAAKMDLAAARASFFPRLDLRAGIGFQAFNPSFLLNPESLVFNAAGDLVAPLVNRNGIRARFNSANSVQVQALLTYQQTVLKAYTEVINQLARLENFSKSFATKSREVEVLNESVNIANNLFQYAKADYVEVLLTQEEVLDAQMELVEIQLEQILAKVHVYEALGGGWQ